MAKREKRQRPVRMTRKYRSRMEKEQHQIRNIFIGIGLVAAVSVFVVLFGLYQTQVAEPEATRSAKKELETISAVTVDGTMISITEWQARVRFERMLNYDQAERINQQMNLFDPATELGQQLIQQGRVEIEQIQNLLELGDSIAADVLNQMVEEQLIRREAARRGIVITPEELQNHIEVTMFAFPFPPTPEPIPTLPAPTLPPTATVTPEPTIAPTAAPTARSREDFEANYGMYTQSIQDVTEMSEEMWRSMVEGSLYREKLLETFQVETSVQQIQGSFITAYEQETTDTLLAQLQGGKSFEELVGEIQADTSEDQSAQAGDFDWAPIATIQQRFGEEFAKVAFNTSSGNYVRESIPTGDGRFFLVYVKGNENQDLSDYMLEQQRQDLFQSWLDQAVRDGDAVHGDWRNYIPREP